MVAGVGFMAFECRAVGWRSALSVCGLAVAIAGCGGPSGMPKHPKMYPVHGEITLDGEPVVAMDTEIEFRPNGQGNGMNGRGDMLVNEEGQYRATSFLDEIGLHPGEYKVLVTGKGIPAKYAKIETTDLTAIVKPEDNTIDLKLTGGSEDAAPQAADAEDDADE
jgi:hypothetical protein